MRKHDLRSRKRRAFRVHTTDSKHAHPIAPNVLERDFNVTAPNQKWLADLTYVPTAEGWLYLALVLNLFARKIVGWATSPTMPQELTLEALQVALGWRDPDAGLLSITLTEARSTRPTTTGTFSKRAVSRCR